jgi:xanthine dehydrogenase YagT iron-sulfur-binding subunit
MTDTITRRAFMRAGAAAAAGATVSASVGAKPVTDETLDFRSPVTTRFTVNGRATSVAHEARVTLLDLLRERLALTGTKKGCNEGACGACTVLLDGRRVNACMLLAASCAGREVVTVEGLAAGDGTLHAVQRAFIEQDAFQCGYCTAGQVVSAVACIREGHTTSREEIAEWMSGNLCRCAAYPQIVAAVAEAAGDVTRA